MHLEEKWVEMKGFKGGDTMVKVYRLSTYIRETFSLGPCEVNIWAEQPVRG